MLETNKFNVSILLLSLIFVGLIGNTINLIVFSHKSMKMNSTFKYLFYLAIVDILVLLICANDSLASFSHFIFVRLHSIMSCKIFTFLTYFLTHLNSLILMVVSIDRAIIICNHQNKNHLNLSNKTALEDLKLKINNLIKSPRKVLISLISLLAILNSHFLAFLTLNNFDQNESNQLIGSENKTYSNYLMCYPLKNEKYSYFLVYVWTWIDVLIYCLIPSVVMTICSIIIILEIKSKSKGFINKHQQTSTNQIICLKSKKRNRQLSLMLFVNNLFFILCSLPLCLNMIFYHFIGQNNETSSFQAYFNIFSYSNNSFSFIFYYISSNKYRNFIKIYFFKKNIKQ